MTFQLSVSNREYTEYQFLTPLREGIDLDVDPAENKLFNGDIFTYKNKVEIEQSKTRSALSIAGVLLLEGNKRYGRHKNRFLYKCVPDDRNLPVFMVPYTIKMNFNKKIYNKYVLFRYDNWSGKHPQGLIIETIGDVTELTNFYRYQLHCKKLHIPLRSFTRETIKVLKGCPVGEMNNIIQNTHKIEDRSSWEVITIDPNDSKDFDDAFGLRILPDSTRCLSIYIANVPVLIDALGLWRQFSDRVATTYLPDKRYPMLPTALSEGLCSLQEKEMRYAFTLDVVIDSKTFKIVKTSFSNTRIQVDKNLRYDTEEQNEHPLYKRTLPLIKNLNKRYRYMDSIKSSHDLVAYMMLLMNHSSAILLSSKECGIFRSIKLNTLSKVKTSVPVEIETFMRAWNSSGGKYLSYEHRASHDMLDLDVYVHITSPIRRLVDLLNMMIIQHKLGLTRLSETGQKFHNRWTSEEGLEHINEKMRDIRKVQNDCRLLGASFDDPSLLSTVHDGFIFDKTLHKDGKYKYAVYLPTLKIVNRFVSSLEMTNLSKHKFRIFVFMDEVQLKQKVRIELQEN